MASEEAASGPAVVGVAAPMASVEAALSASSDASAGGAGGAAAAAPPSRIASALTPELPPLPPDEAETTSTSSSSRSSIVAPSLLIGSSGSLMFLKTGATAPHCAHSRPSRKYFFIRFRATNMVHPQFSQYMVLSCASSSGVCTMCRSAVADTIGASDLVPSGATVSSGFLVILNFQYQNTNTSPNTQTSPNCMLRTIVTMPSLTALSAPRMTPDPNSIVVVVDAPRRRGLAAAAAR
mmetsp:Transcript_18013/g.72201  ORF Transcript_18013/g.72201 Transcript_18013/m.72201 type:complete len:237 (+) Transcript_18013:806-1516(+)